jgi:hypothetical protein
MLALFFFSIYLGHAVGKNAKIHRLDCPLIPLFPGPLDVWTKTRRQIWTPWCVRRICHNMWKFPAMGVFLGKHHFSTSVFTVLYKTVRIKHCELTGQFFQVLKWIQGSHEIVREIVKTSTDVRHLHIRTNKAGLFRVIRKCLSNNCLNELLNGGRIRNPSVSLWMNE